MSKDGFDEYGYYADGFNKEGIHKATGTTFNKEGIHKATGTTFNQEGFDKDGFDKLGYDQDRFNKNGYDKNGFDKNGTHIATHTLFDTAGFNKEGFDGDGFDKLGKNKQGLTSNEDELENKIFEEKQLFIDSQIDIPDEGHDDYVEQRELDNAGNCATDILEEEANDYETYNSD